MAEFLGVPGKKGVLIVGVLGGSASEGKLRAGDVVVGVNGREIASPADLTNAVQEAASGDITVGIIRDGKQVSVTVSLPSSNENERRGGYRL
jgi:S1-C subfamily serine protease